MGLHEIGSGQNIQVKRKCRAWQPETTGYGARREAVGGVAHEKTKYIKSRFLR